MKSSLSFTDSDLDLLKGDVDAAVEVLEGQIDGELDTARNEINEKIKSLREIMKANAGGGLNEEDATALINDVTQKTNCKFMKYLQYLVKILTCSLLFIFFNLLAKNAITKVCFKTGSIILKPEVVDF